jgi:hypothetical protein
VLRDKLAERGVGAERDFRRRGNEIIPVVQTLPGMSRGK